MNEQLIEVSVKQFLYKKPTKEHYNLFKWLKECGAQDKIRPAFGAFHVTDSTFFQATNGYRFVMADLEHPLEIGGGKLPNGLWTMPTLNRSIIAFEKIEANFPMAKWLLHAKSPDLEKENVITMSPDELIPVIKPFKSVTQCIITKSEPMQFVLQGEGFPKGDYLGILMPRYGQLAFEGIQEMITYFHDHYPKEDKDVQTN